VGTQVSGVIERIYVDFNSQVKKGQLLAELDKSTLRERLIQAQASVSGAESDLQFMQQNYDRVRQLYDAKAATQTAYEDAINRLTQAKTSVANARANLQQAQVNLGYAEIYSPIDGIILHRAVEQGQTVAATFSTPTLFTIANDLKRMKVEADVDEADIGQVQVGQEVRFTVDAYPNDVFGGTVHQIRLQPSVTSNVVTYTVIVEAPNPDEKLFPGMTASITVVVDAQKGLVMPVSAINYKPSKEVMEKLKIQSSATERDASGSVWVKNDDKTIRHKLETGLSDGLFVVVTKGLHVGDTVILSASIEKKSK
jgi:HlyD family secretion protein